MVLLLLLAMQLSTFLQVSGAVVFLLLRCSNAFLTFHASSQLIHRHRLLAKSESNQDEDDHDDAISTDVDIDDWRAFRAQLVARNQGDEDSGDIKTSSSSSYAYDSGNMIEKGSIILAKVEPDFCYFGLNQQYFHKSVMLVTYHEDKEFTKGIILNRPTNLFLDDEDFLDDDGEPYFKTDGKNGADDNDVNSWRIWFGGDVRGLYADDSEGGTEIVCLHSIQTELARNVSEEILKNVFTTNYEGARKLIDANEAVSDDFWVFAGYAGWSAGQLEEELNRESWYMISADSETVWNELTDQRDDETLDPRDAGLKSWSTLMGMLGKHDEARAVSESFADLSLKEWAAESILFNSTLPVVNENDDLDDLIKSLSPSVSSSIDSAEFVDLAKRFINDGLQGTVLRGSSKDRSPFLLSDQKLHKCSMLVIQDDEVMTVGVLLNHPMTKTYPVSLANGDDIEFPVRYGGSFGIPGIVDQPIIFLHSKPELKSGVGVGEPVCRSTDGAEECMIWICSEQQAAYAIESGRASLSDFMCVQGFQIWPKEDVPSNSGIFAQLVTGDLEVVDEKLVEEMWKVLSLQSQLSLSTIEQNFQASLLAWSVGGKENGESSPPFVYDSTVTTSQLADDSLRYWTEAFLLGGVVSAGKYDYSSGFE